MDQSKDFVARCESRNEPLAMFDDSALEVVGYAGVQVSRAAGESVNAVGVAHSRLEEKADSSHRQTAAGSE